MVVDIERGRTIKGWKPRRLGGGKGGRKSHYDPNSETTKLKGLDEVEPMEERNSLKRPLSRDRERDRGDRRRSKERDTKRSRSRSRDRKKRSKSRGNYNFINFLIKYKY